MPSEVVQVIVRARNETAAGLAAARAGIRKFASGTIGELAGVKRAIFNIQNLVIGGVAAKLMDALTRAGDQIDKMSQRLAVTTEEFQVLRHAIELGGGDVGMLQMAFQGLARQIFQANAGLAQSQRYFQVLGLSWEELARLSPVEQFKRVLAALGRMTDASQKQAAALGIFGRAGLNLMPVINSLGGNLDALAERMRRNGQIMSEDAVRRSAEFRDALTDLNRAIQAAAIEALVRSGRLKEWGREAAEIVRELYAVVKDLGGFVIEHRDVLATLGFTYAGARVLTAMNAGLVTLQAALAQYTTAQTVAATATAATTAQMTAQSAAAASRLAPALLSVAGALRGLGAVAGAALAGWGIGRIVAQVTGLDAAVTKLYGKIMGWDLSKAKWGAEEKKEEHRRMFLERGGRPEDFEAYWKRLQEYREARKRAAARNRRKPPPGAGAGGAASAAEAEAEEFAVFQKRMSDLARKVKVGMKTGDRDIQEMWAAITGQAPRTPKEVSASAMSLAGAFRRLQKIGDGDWRVGLEVVRARVQQMQKLREQWRRAREEESALASDIGQGGPDPFVDAVNAQTLRVRDRRAAVRRLREEAERLRSEAEAAWRAAVMGEKPGEPGGEKSDDEKKKERRARRTVQRGRRRLMETWERIPEWARDRVSMEELMDRAGLSSRTRRLLRADAARRRAAALARRAKMLERGEGPAGRGAGVGARPAAGTLGRQPAVPGLRAPSSGGPQTPPMDPTLNTLREIAQYSKITAAKVDRMAGLAGA